MSRILKIAHMLRQKEISSKELTTKYLCAINRDNQLLNAYVNISEDEAILSASAFDRRFAVGEDMDILSGIPMTLKDNISTKGIYTTCCSKILDGYKPVYDATAWSRLKDKGAVMLGKTNMDEFAMGCSSETSVFGTTKNPHNTDFVAGGSSGGTACAVAANLAVYGLGSDTGGSVRQPAAFCGCVGFKPSYGVISRYGLVAYASSLDTIGIIAGSVTDTALVFDRISGFDPMDSTSKADFAANTYNMLNKSLKGKHLGIPKELIDPADEDVKAEFFKAVREFEALGCEVEYFSLPMLSKALPAYYVIACAEASSNLGRYDSVRYGDRADCFESIHQMICKTRGEKFGEEVKKRIMLGTFVLSEGYYDKYYAKAQILRSKLLCGFEELFKKYDALISPVSPTTAFKSGQAKQDSVTSFNADLCTVPANLAGLPAVSLPCGKNPQGLPVGLQLIGNKFGDNSLLNLAYKYEEARGGYEGIKDLGVSFDV